METQEPGKGTIRRLLYFEGQEREGSTLILISRDKNIE